MGSRTGLLELGLKLWMEHLEIVSGHGLVAFGSLPLFLVFVFHKLNRGRLQSSNKAHVSALGVISRAFLTQASRGSRPGWLDQSTFHSIYTRMARDKIQYQSENNSPEPCKGSLCVPSCLKCHPWPWVLLRSLSLLTGFWRRTDSTTWNSRQSLKSRNANKNCSGPTGVTTCN